MKVKDIDVSKNSLFFEAVSMPIPKFFCKIYINKILRKIKRAGILPYDCNVNIDLSYNLKLKFDKEIEIDNAKGNGGENES